MKKNFIKFAFQAFLFALFAAAVMAQSPGGVGTSNLKIWLRADAGISVTTNGAAVPAWVDQSPGALSFAADHLMEQQIQHWLLPALISTRL